MDGNAISDIPKTMEMHRFLKTLGMPERALLPIKVQILDHSLICTFAMFLLKVVSELR